MKEWIVQYWLAVVFGVATTVFSFVVKKLAKKINEQESLKLGVQALLRDRILQQYTYYMDKGYCPIYGRENLDALSKEYYNLGGNGVIHSIMDKLEELPTEKEEVVVSKNY